MQYIGWRFIGKSSPVHFFWGSFDLAVTRFSGRRGAGAGHTPGWITREAYSHEVQQLRASGLGSGPVQEAAFYAYAYPEPPGFADAVVGPSGAVYNTQLGEFVCPTRSCAARRRLMRRCWSFWERPTWRRRRSGAGTGRRWSVAGDGGTRSIRAHVLELLHGGQAHATFEMRWPICRPRRAV